METFRIESLSWRRTAQEVRRELDSISTRFVDSQNQLISTQRELRSDKGLYEEHLQAKDRELSLALSEQQGLATRLAISQESLRSLQQLAGSDEHHFITERITCMNGELISCKARECALER